MVEGTHPGTPFRNPHSEQRGPARAHAVGPVLGPNARTDRIRDTRVAEPRPPAPEGGQLGEGQRLTPDAPHNGGRPCPPGTAPRHPGVTQPPQGMQAKGPPLGPHTHTPAATACGWRTPTARPVGGQFGEGERLTTDAPDNGNRPPPPGTATHHPRGTQPPRGMQAKGTVLGPHTHTPAPTARGWRTPTARPVGRQSGEGQRLTSDAPHNDGRHPPPGTPFRHPHSEQRRPARAHAVGPVLGRHARIDRTRDTRVAEPLLPAPDDGRPGEGQRLTPDAPHNGGRHPPRGRPSATPTASNAGPQGRTLWGWCWVPTPAPTAPGTHGSRSPGCPLQRTGGSGRDSA